MSTRVINVDAASVEYLYFPIESNTDASQLTNGAVAFSPHADLPDSPTWISADIVISEPEAGVNSLRILFGSDVTLDEGVYWWWGKVTDGPETPVERGPNRIRVM